MAHRMLQGQQHVFRYQSFIIDKSQPLGHGSYGAVYKAKCDQLPCAAKILHPTILDPTDPGASKIMERFQQECAFLESIRHPNVVQYLGIAMEPESRLPLLLMELLDESLTKMLERSQQSLAYYVQVDICHDIALAVAYLHSNDIIHRDLSSNNVLIITERRAKVTDFGMSKLAGAAPSITPLTSCPGTVAYMPPEAVREPPSYTKKLDCFSEGVIMIQVCTQLWPDPGPRTQIVEDSHSPLGIIEMPFSEIERRKNHIDLIDPNHALLPIAKDCIHFQDKDRPSSEELCQKLASLKETREYRENSHQIHDGIQSNDNQIHVLTQLLEEKDTMLREKDREILSLGLQIQDRQLKEEISSRNEHFQQLKQKLENQEQVTAEIQQTNHSLRKQVEQLQKQLNQQSLKPPQPPPPYQAQVRRRQLQERPKQLPILPSLQVDHKPHPRRDEIMTLNWRDGGKAPFAMERGAAVVDGDMAYFMNHSGAVCSYSLTTESWSVLPKYSYEFGSLTVINEQLTAIGGCKNWRNKYTHTNKLLSLHEGWVEVFPPMTTKRRSTIAVTSKKHLIVAGGRIGPHIGEFVTTVEVMDTEALVWSTVASLPHPYCGASGIICGDRIFMLGGWDDKGKTKSVLTCSLTKLIQSSSSSSSSIVWYRVTDAPAYHSTCAAVNGELLAVGGHDEDDKPTAAIHKYNSKTNLWDTIGNMPSVRYRSLIAVLPTNKMMVVGAGMYHQDTVEIANIDIS